MLERLGHLPEPTSGRGVEVDLQKQFFAALEYYNAISKQVGPDHESDYPDDMRYELAKTLGSRWLIEHARCIFPEVDEFEITKELVVEHPDHDQREDHQRVTMQQLKAWIDAQRHNMT